MGFLAVGIILSGLIGFIGFLSFGVNLLTIFFCLFVLAIGYLFGSALEKN